MYLHDIMNKIVKIQVSKLGKVKFFVLRSAADPLGRQ